MAPRVSWRLASSGPERMPKIVYVRFRGGESGRETYTDDIILDQRPPQVGATSLVASQPTQGSSPATSDATKSLLRVTGKDDNAGIRAVTVSKRPGGKAIANKRLARRNARGRLNIKTTVRLSPRLRTVYVRMTDVAGNRSRWKTVHRHVGRHN